MISSYLKGFFQAETAVKRPAGQGHARPDEPKQSKLYLSSRFPSHGNIVKKEKGEYIRDCLWKVTNKEKKTWK